MKKCGRSNPSLDLHGRSVEQALHEIEYFISDAVMANLGQVEIIHGLGSGKVQRATHGFLKKCGVVRAFKLKEGNPGTTVVFF